MTRYVPSEEAPPSDWVKWRVELLPPAEQALIKAAAAALAKSGKGHHLGPDLALAAVYALGCWMQKNTGVRVEVGDE